MIAARQIFLGRGGGAKVPYDAEVEWIGVDTIGPYITITGIEWDSFSCSMYVPAQSAQGFKDFIGGNYIYYGCNCIRSQNGEYRGAQFMGLSGTVNFITDRFVEYYSPSPANKKWMIDGAEYSVVVCNNTGGSFGIFHLPIAAPNVGQFKIAWVQTHKSGEKTLDLIPVRVGTEGAMYDRVSKQLFRNAGTGAFIIGNDK